MREAHHAYLIVGERRGASLLFDSLISDLGISTRSNPDFFKFELETFGIDDSRMLSERARERGFGGKKAFLLLVDRITIEAQNALLKVFEEPTEETYYFLITREEGLIIPTLRSRMQLHRPHSMSNDVALGSQFHSMSLRDRLKFSKDFSDRDGDLASLMDEILVYSKGRLDMKVIGEIFSLRRFVGDRSVSRRLVLDHLAMLLPT